MTDTLKLEKVQELIDAVERELALTVPGSFEADILQSQLVALESTKATLLTSNIIHMLMGK